MENKIIATFNAYTEQEALIFANAKKMANVLWELQHNFHRKFKHNEVSQNEILFQLDETLIESGINIDDLIN